jgi:Ni/Co efflux regulator RcnB
MKYFLLSTLLASSFYSFSYSAKEEDDQNKDYISFETVSSDTITAVQNLFQRKRAGGRTGGVIFGILAGSSLATGISSGLAGNFLLAGVFGALTFNSLSKGKKYSAERLEQVISDYQKTNTLPPDILKKLKKKDFK